MVTVDAAGDGHEVASMTVAPGAHARFGLTPGTYTITGTFANVGGIANGPPSPTVPKTVTVPAGKTVRRDVVAYVPGVGPYVTRSAPERIHGTFGPPGGPFVARSGSEVKRVT
jgi:hypothetical protein